MLGNDYAAQDCSIARALEVVGERWTLLLLRDAFLGVRRFNDFQVHLDIPRGVLAERLRHLVADGVLRREPDPADGRSAVYELTPEGRELWPVLHALTVWGGRRRAGAGRRRFLHVPCGTELDAQAACPACGVVPPAADVLTTYGAARSDARTDRVSVALREPRRLLAPLDAAA